VGDPLLMTSEANWYLAIPAGMRQPPCRRLSRLPADVQWEAAIELALRYAAGEAQYLPHRRSYCDERFWLAPTYQPPYRSETAIRSDWWMIPPRVHRRILQLVTAADEHLASRSTDGSLDNLARAGVLARLKRTGKWRRVIGDAHFQREIEYRKRIEEKAGRSGRRRKAS